MEYKIHFEVICKRCGKHLKAEMNWRHNVLVEPCPNCCENLKGEKDERERSN